MELKQYTVISTFAGCGGSSLGYKWAGFKELLAIDFDENAHETFKMNFDCPAWLRDIKTVTVDGILEFCKIEIGELDIIDARFIDNPHIIYVRDPVAGLNIVLEIVPDLLKIIFEERGVGSSRQHPGLNFWYIFNSVLSFYVI